MITPKMLADAFQRNVGIAHMECEGLTHEESLLQPPANGNCMNWVLGHMLVGRNDVLHALGALFQANPAALVRYKRESAPITEAGAEVLPLSQILAWLTEGQTHISERLTALTEDGYTQEVRSQVTERTTTVGKLVFFQYFHDCYHAGQTNLLRQLAGKNDKTI